MIFSGVLRNFKYTILPRICPSLPTVRYKSSIFNKCRIIPDVIKKDPPQVLSVSYSGCCMTPGEHLFPRDVNRIPTVNWKCRKNQFYTLMMLDPDAPSRKKPSQKYWNHWMVGNIDKNNIHNGKVLVDYVGAAPPKGTGDHRYVFLVFQQDKEFTFEGEEIIPNYSAEGRNNFSLHSFVTRYGMRGPVGVNFFHAHYEKFVIQIYRQLGM